MIECVRLSTAVAQRAEVVEAPAGVLEGRGVLAGAASYQTELELHSRLALAIADLLTGSAGEFVKAGGVLPVRRALQRGREGPGKLDHMRGKFMLGGVMRAHQDVGPLGTQPLGGGTRSVQGRWIGSGGDRHLGTAPVR